MIKTNIKNYFKFTLVVVSLLLGLVNPTIAQEKTVDDLTSEITTVKNKLEDLKKQAAVYQKNIRLKQEESMSLKNQLEILANQVAKTKLDIESTNEEIKKTELEMKQIQLDLIKTGDHIDKKKSELGEVVRRIQAQKNKDYLEIFVLNDSVSDFFADIQSTENLTDSLNDSLVNVKELKNDLTQDQEVLNDKKNEFEKLKDTLEFNEVELDAQLKYKENLLADTKQSEDKFYNLFWQVKQEQEDANNDVYNLEKKMRQKLEESKETKQQLTDSILIWPVPKNKITSTFHDPDYPFRHIFEHPAVDIRAAQGTQIKAATDGYVLTAKNAGMGYSYIALVHANGLSTVYGHVSKIYVKADEYVTKGEVIGLSGGMPGTPGAGNLCTGPHLHFEVRLNGIPVDPMNYLP